MASTIAASGTGRLPWYRRLFGGGTTTRVSAVDAAPKSAPKVVYSCRECRFEATLRGTVYDHIKSFHKDVLDRHGRIEERPAP